jgi:hypothetical protein
MQKRKNGKRLGSVKTGLATETNEASKLNYERYMNFHLEVVSKDTVLLVDAFLYPLVTLGTTTQQASKDNCVTLCL